MTNILYFGGAGHAISEKGAWLSLLGMAVTFGPYLVVTGMQPSPDTMPNLQLLSRLAVTAVALMLILGIGHLVLRLRAPVDARPQADERDRAIERRSMRLAYYVLIAGMIPWSASLCPSTRGLGHRQRRAGIHCRRRDRPLRRGGVELSTGLA